MAVDNSASDSVSGSGTITIETGADNKRIIIDKVIISTNSSVASAFYVIKENNTVILHEQYFGSSQRQELKLLLYLTPGTDFKITITLFGVGAKMSYYIEYRKR